MTMEACLNISLNDIAAFLIQIDYNEKSELNQLMEMLKQGAKDDAYPTACREIFLKAITIISSIINSTVGDIEQAISEVNRLIEDAMNAVEESKKVDPTSKLPDKSEKIAETVAPVIQKEKEQSKISDTEEEKLPDDIDADLLSAFVTESGDLIAKAEEALLSLEKDPENMEAVGIVFRAFHTIKGTAAFLKLSLISEIAHHAESLLSKVRDNEIRYEGVYADLALQSVDMLKSLVQAVTNAIADGSFIKPDGYQELIENLLHPEKLIQTKALEDEVAEFKPRIGDILVAQGKADRKILEEIAATPDDKPIGEKIVRSKAASLIDVAKSLRTQQKLQTRQTAAENTVRVPVERLDRFIDMVGELVVSHSMVAQDEIVTKSTNHELFKKVSQTGKIVRELQTMSMSMRMVPLKQTFQKMARLVRDLAKKTNKKINFLTEGEDTEIDRNMVDIINDPLVHMIRNAIDHGIEPPEEREKKGKSSFGIIQLSAYHTAGNIVVEIKDDGRGLDKNLILSKAIDRGLIKEDHDRQLSEREIFNLIFEPGFSTAQVVSEVSGRGVGMDVVKRNVEALRGQIDIQSKVGEGSTFKISFPLTLAIIDGMVIRVGNQRYVLPTVSIVRSIQLSKHEIVSVLKRGEMLRILGKLIPLFRLAELFEIDETEKNLEKAIVVIVEDDGKQAGLLIDELIGTQQIVIKTLGDILGHLTGISGSAIMPDGRVGLILDVSGLVRLANEPYRR